MSVPFNDTSTYRGQTQLFERMVGKKRGAVSGDTDLMKEFAAYANLSLDEFWEIAFRSGGTWQPDDTNHTKYPIITTSIVSGQRDYSFGNDEQGNQILDIHKVLVADSSGTFHELTPVDVQSEKNLLAFQTSTSTGVPIKYDKTANALFFDPAPNYNYSGGLKVYINREPSYFAYTDTTKAPGIPSLFHEYIALGAAYRYACDNSHSAEASLFRRKSMMEMRIEEHFSRRNRDERKRLAPSRDSNK